MIRTTAISPSFLFRRQFQVRCTNGLAFILPLALPAPTLAHDMPVYTSTPQHVLVRDESLQPGGPAHVDTPRADADLSTDTIAEAVCEAGARIYKYARRVNARTNALPAAADSVTMQSVW